MRVTSAPIESGTAGAVVDVVVVEVEVEVEVDEVEVTGAASGCGCPLSPPHDAANTPIPANTTNSSFALVNIPCTLFRTCTSPPTRAPKAISVGFQRRCHELKDKNPSRISSDNA
jgi:hypothetical protein